MCVFLCGWAGGRPGKHERESIAVVAVVEGPAFGILLGVRDPGQAVAGRMGVLAYSEAEAAGGRGVRCEGAAPPGGTCRSMLCGGFAKQG